MFEHLKGGRKIAAIGIQLAIFIRPDIPDGITPRYNNVGGGYDV